MRQQQVRSLFPADELEKPRQRERRPFDVKSIMRQIEEADAEKQVHLPSWRSAFNLAMPDRRAFDGEAPGQARIPQESQDSHPLMALRRGVGNIVAALVPPEHDWAEIVPGPAYDDAMAQKMSKGLEKIRKKVFEGLTLAKFGSRVHEAMHDMMVSTAFIAIDVGTRKDPFRIRVGGLNECYPVEGPNGEIATNHRRYSCRVKYLHEQWPGIKLNTRLAEIEKRNPEAKVEIIESSIYEPGWGYRTTICDPAAMEILLNIEPEDPEEPSRWICPRLYVRPQEVYGTGALIEALPSMRYLNKSLEQRLRGRMRRDNPGLLMDTETGLSPHTMRFGPNFVGMINGAGLMGRPPFYELPSGQPDPLESYEINDHRRIIDDILFATQVVPPVADSRQMTAFEVSVRRQQMLLQQGVDLGRLLTELPFAVMRRCVWVLSKLELIPEITIDGRMFDIRYRGPLSQAQDQEKASQIFNFIAAARSAVGDEAMALGVKIEDAVVKAGELWPGLPNSLLRDEQEREQMQKQAAAIMALQASGDQPPQMQESALPGEVQ